MGAPYREPTCSEVFEAPTRAGMARLEVAPRHAVLAFDDRVHLTVTDRFVTVPGRAHRRPRSLKLDGARLLVARGVPVEDVAIWYQGKRGKVARIFAVRPLELLDAHALSARRALDQLVAGLQSALARHQGTALRAWEFGRGADRVLVVDHGDRYVVYVRPMFRERPRRALEVRRDGTVAFRRKKGDEVIKCESRFGVTVLGDQILFSDVEGCKMARLWLPWIEHEDRVALARCFGERLHQERDLTCPG